MEKKYIGILNTKSKINGQVKFDTSFIHVKDKTNCGKYTEFTDVTDDWNYLFDQNDNLIPNFKGFYPKDCKMSLSGLKTYEEIVSIHPHICLPKCIDLYDLMKIVEIMYSKTKLTEFETMEIEKIIANNERQKIISFTRGE